MVKMAKYSNRHNFISVQDIDTIFPSIARFSGSTNSSMLSKISRKPRELPWQPNLVKQISQNCTDFSSVQAIEEFIACTVESTGLVN